MIKNVAVLTKTLETKTDQTEPDAYENTRKSRIKSEK